MLIPFSHAFNWSHISLIYVCFVVFFCSIYLKLNILNFHKWFHGFVPGWINVATEKCESHIRQAIELDEIVKITEDLKLSSSAVDTNGFLLQMATFWHHLDWPMAFEAYAYVISLVEKICCCANLYIGEVFASLSPEDLRDDQGRFRASERVSCHPFHNQL